MTTIVAVCGKGRDCPRAMLRLAGDVGYLLAKMDDVTVLTGGLGGVMEAAAQGAYRNGGRTISLLPVGREADAHPHTDLALRTGLTPPWRNVLLGSMADAAVILPGSHGTLQEATILIDAEMPVVFVGDHFGWLTEGLAGSVAIAWDADALGGICRLAAMLGLREPVP